jgi:hypothetical protein
MRGTAVKSPRPSNTVARAFISLDPVNKCVYALHAASNSAHKSQLFRIVNTTLPTTSPAPSSVRSVISSEATKYPSAIATIGFTKA